MKKRVRNEEIEDFSLVLKMVFLHGFDNISPIVTGLQLSKSVFRWIMRTCLVKIFVTTALSMLDSQVPKNYLGLVLFPSNLLFSLHPKGIFLETVLTVDHGVEIGFFLCKLSFSFVHVS